MNITFQIIIASATHEAVDPQGLHLGGEILAVYPHISDPATVGSRVGFGHIDNVPVESIGQLSFLLDPNNDSEGKMISRSLWRVDSSAMTLSELMMVGNTNMLSADWGRFKEVCKNVVTGLNLTDDDIA